MKQQRTADRTNIQRTPTMTMKKMSLFISNPVRVPGGKSVVKLSDRSIPNFPRQPFVFFLLQVAQRDIPGIDASYLAMDTEEGVEVVWNEVLFSERKISEIQHVRMEMALDRNEFFSLFSLSQFRTKLATFSIN